MPTRRVRMLVRRHLRLIAKGKSCFDQANTALALAMTAGLKVGQPVELEIGNPETGKIDKEQFHLVDNFLGDVAYKPARVPHYEFKRIPKAKRGSPQPLNNRRDVSEASTSSTSQPCP